MKIKKLQVKKTVIRSLSHNEMTEVAGGRITWSSEITSACAAGVIEGADWNGGGDFTGLCRG